MLAVHDLGDEGATAAAAGAGSAMVGHVVRTAGPVLNAGSDLAVGYTVAVADDHRRLLDRSLLKVIVKVIL